MNSSMSVAGGTWRFALHMSPSDPSRTLNLVLALKCTLNKMCLRSTDGNMVEFRFISASVYRPKLMLRMSKRREMQINRSLLWGALVSILLGIAGGITSVPAQAVPNASSPDFIRLIVPVADRCGFNKYRDARGICRPKYVIERYRKRPLYGACGGANSYRVCNLYGQCWMVCD